MLGLSSGRGQEYDLHDIVVGDLEVVCGKDHG